MSTDKDGQLGRPIYGVRGVGAAACLAVNQEVRVRVPSDTLLYELKGRQVWSLR
jgi:hypothetical protein